MSIDTTNNIKTIITSESYHHQIHLQKINPHLLRLQNYKEGDKVAEKQTNMERCIHLFRGNKMGLQDIIGITTTTKRDFLPLLIKILGSKESCKNSNKNLN